MSFNNKKIIIAADIFPPEIGGPATYSVELGNLLSKNNFDVKLICYSNFYVKDNYQFLVFRVKNTKFKIWNYIKYFLKLFFLSIDSKLIYAQGPVNAGLPALLVAKILRKKLIIKVVGDYAWEQFRNINKKSTIDIDSFQKNSYGGKIGFLKKIEFLVCRQADKIITPSNYLKGIVIGWGVDSNKIIVIYNSFCLAKYSYLPQRDLARKELGFNNFDFIIISIGRPVFWKGFGLLHLVVDDLIKINNWPIKLRIIGITPEELKFFINIEDPQYLIKDSVLFEEAVGKKSKEDIYKYLSLSDVFILNTGYEGLSHVILEAMAYGIPVITTNVCGNPELIKNGVNGILIEYNNKEQLKSAIIDLYKNKDLRNKFSNVSKSLLNNFSQEKMESSILKLLNKIMNNEI